MAPSASAGVEARVVQVARVALAAVGVVGVVAQAVPAVALAVAQAVPAAERTPLGQLTWAALVVVEAMRKEAAARRIARSNESSSQQRL